MNRLAIAAALAMILCVPAAWTQDNAGESSATELADATPAQNASPGSVRLRAPGTWITAARARHSQLIDQRVNGPRFGLFVEDDLQADSGGTDSTGSPSSLGDLIGQLTGSGALGSLAGLLGGTSLGEGFAASGGALGSGTGNALSEAFPNVPADVLQAILDAGIDVSQLTGKSRTDATTRTTAQLADKSTSSTAQTQDNRKFHARLTDSLLSTFFTALTVGFQSQAFIDALTDSLRPIFAPPADDDTSDDTGGDSGGDGTPGTGDSGGSDTGGDTGSGGDGGSGGGIEDLPSGDGGSDGDGSGSII